MKQEFELIIRTETREIWSVRRISFRRTCERCEQCGRSFDLTRDTASGSDMSQREFEELKNDTHG